MKHDYFDVYYQPGEDPVFCYRSGLAVYEEGLVRGAFVSRGYNPAGYPLNTLTNCPTRIDPKKFDEPFAFRLEINGVCLGYDLKFVDFSTEKTEKNLHAVITLESTLLPVQVKVHTLLDGTAMFTRWLEIENRSREPMRISRLAPMAGGLEVMDRTYTSLSNDLETFYSVGYFDEDSWGREGDFNWHHLQPDVTAVETRFNRQRYRHPVMFLRNNLTGMLWFSQIAYSGGCRFTLDYNAKRESKLSTLAFQAEVTGYAPLIVLDGGETFTSPKVHMGVLQGDLDEAVNEMHAHARKSVLNLPEADPSACYIGAGMGAEHDMSVETSKAFIDQFAEMGGEIFIIDAGWQNPPHEEMKWWPYNGINLPNPERYPNGLAELSDYCHEKGMKFALWVEIERLGEYAPAWKEHPQWRQCNIYGEQSGGFLDFTNPEVAKWAEDELARIITEYKLDLLRVDYNVDYREYHAMKPHPRGGKEYTALRHFEAVGKMYRNLKKRFPHVLFENCAGGGGRTDYAQMQAFHHTWVSDWQKVPRSVLITNGMTMALPPERVDRLFAGMGCHSIGGLDAHMRNTMFGHMSLNVVAPAATCANPKQMEFVRHSVAVYKDFIRPFLPGCKIYHATPETKKALEQGYMQLEITAADGTRGALGVFTLPQAPEQAIFAEVRGMDAGKTYRITMDNTGYTYTASGGELLEKGIRVKIAGALSSELILYEAI